MTRCPECFNHKNFCTCNKSRENIFTQKEEKEEELHIGFYL